MRKGGGFTIWIILCLLGVCRRVTGTRDQTGRMLLQDPVAQLVTIPAGKRQPVSFVNNDFDCIKYSFVSTGFQSGDSAEILAFVMNRDQMSALSKEVPSAGFIVGSDCIGSRCERITVDLPGSKSERPFFIMFVNAKHDRPEFNNPFGEDVTVRFWITSCSGDGTEVQPFDVSGLDAPDANNRAPEEKKKKKSNFNIWMVLGPLIFLVVAVFICVFIAIRLNHRRAREDDYAGSAALYTEYPTGQTAGSQHSRSKALYADYPQDNPMRRGPTGSSPLPAQPGGGETHQIFNNSLWGRASFAASRNPREAGTRFRSLNSIFSWRRPAGVDVERDDNRIDVAPREDAEDVEEGEEVVTHVVQVREEGGEDSEDDGSEMESEEMEPVGQTPEPDKKGTKVFINAMYDRVRRSMSLGSRNERDRNRQVKLKSMNSIARWMRGSTLRRTKEEDEGVVNETNGGPKHPHHPPVDVPQPPLISQDPAQEHIAATGRAQGFVYRNIEQRRGEGGTGLTDSDDSDDVPLEGRAYVVPGDGRLPPSESLRVDTLAVERGRAHTDVPYYLNPTAGRSAFAGPGGDFEMDGLERV